MNKGLNRVIEKRFFSGRARCPCQAGLKFDHEKCRKRLKFLVTLNYTMIFFRVFRVFRSLTLLFKCIQNTQFDNLTQKRIKAYSIFITGKD